MELSATDAEVVPNINCTFEIEVKFGFTYPLRVADVVATVDAADVTTVGAA